MDDTLSWIVIVILVCFSALFSGLTLGLMGLDKNGLQIIMNGDNPELAEMAAQIAPLRENGNLLLCTLLFGNVVVNAYLSILMAELTSGYLGLAYSSLAIVIFGEIIPQASCSRYALQIGSRMIPIVTVLIFMFYPITKPISWLLDYCLGDELGTIHSKTELAELLRIHVMRGALDVETGNITTGAVTYQDKKVKEVMSPYNEAMLLNASDLLNFKKITEIFKSGYSRIPVFEKDKHDVIGVLLVKDLIFVDPDDETPVRNFIQIFGRNFHLIWPNDKLGDVLKLFKKGKSHMAIVRDVNNEGEGDPFYEMKGIVTLEDILEEILQDEIKDETDADNLGAGGDSDDDGDDTEKVAVFDYGKLRLLDSGRLEYDKLTPEESLAIGAHFMKNVKAFSMTDVSSIIKVLDIGDPRESVKDIIQKPLEIDGQALDSTTQSPAPGTLVAGAVKRRSSKEDGLRINSVMEYLLDSMPVLDQNRVAPEDEDEPRSADFLYKKGEVSDYMIMILTGRVRILSGKDNFRSDAGPWTVIGSDALIIKNDGNKGKQSMQKQKEPFVPDFTAYIASDHLRYIKISRADFAKALGGEFVWKQSIKSKGSLFKGIGENSNETTGSSAKSTSGSSSKGLKIDDVSITNVPSTTDIESGNSTNNDETDSLLNTKSI